MSNQPESVLDRNIESDYLKEFNLAVVTTKLHGLGEFSELRPTPERLVVGSSMEKLSEHQIIGRIDPDTLFAMCFHTHIQLQKIIDEIFQTKSILTLGYVEYNSGRKIHYESMDRILSRMQIKQSRKEVNMHCWLTLPTSEIIDLTLPTTLAIIENKMENVGSVIAMFANDLKGMKYVPQLVGENYLHMAGIYDKSIPRLGWF